MLTKETPLGLPHSCWPAGDSAIKETLQLCRNNSGELARLLSGRADAVQAVDSDPVITAQAQKLTPSGFPVTFTVAEAIAEFPVGPYDVITCVATIHHLPFTQALTRFRRHLAPGGTLVIVGRFRAQVPVDHLLGVVASVGHSGVGDSAPRITADS
ncbi:class I SAM-dependent methyltransferase [Streptomyces sp. NPDC006332]|uniref:class I SAM-dependent methyltransferase n=1 Tax=Streptomyces sp. NPDC006332 TaxID=3155456 RepID=UPI0033BD5017